LYYSVFAIHARDRHCIIDACATHSDGLNAHCADSESQILAIKLFSWSQALRLIGARQNRFFGRIAPTDSPGLLSVAAMIFDL
jgi:hypothetical protein